MQMALATLEQKALRQRALVVDSATDACVTVAGVEMVCLCSNNYLGLANHPEVRQAASRAVAEWGVGAGSSRLIGGTTRVHHDLQQALAQFEGAESAIVTGSGWQANACALSALAGDGDLILADKLCHASILDAARNSGAVLRVWRHGDMEHLEKLLVRLRASHDRCVLVTDGLFSMDGDVAPLKALVGLKQRFEAVLMVDEAHATGVLGDQGRGAAEAAGVEEDVDVTVGTLSKALGALGGFVAGPRVLTDAILNMARPFIYTTALPAAACAAALAALDLVQREPDRRAACLRNAGRLRTALVEAGLVVGPGTAQIIPVMLGTPQRALDVSRRCFQAGFLAPAIRPPTVPPEGSRLRVSVVATHPWNDLRRFVEVLAKASA